MDHFYSGVINRDFLHEKYKADVQMLRRGGYIATIHFPTLKAGAGSIRADGRYKAMSMPPMGHECFWHAMVTVFNAHVSSNKYTVRSLKDIYRDAAMKHKDLFVPHMYTEVEYAYMIEGRTQDTLSAKHEADASVAHVVASEIGIPINGIDDTGKQVLGYRVGSGDPETRCVIVRHGHAYVPTSKIPKEDIAHIPPYDHHVALVFKGDEFEHIDDEEVEESKEDSDDSSSDGYEDEEIEMSDSSEETAAEEVETTTDFVSAIQAALAFLQGDTKTGRAIAIAQAVAPLVTLSCGMYTLIRGIVQGVWKWHDYLVHSTSLVSTMVTIYACFWDVANKANIAKMLLKLSISCLSDITCAGGAIYTLAMKMITVFGAGTMVASGFASSVTKFGSIVSAVKQTGDYMTDIITTLGHLFGFDLTDCSDLNTVIIARTKKVHGYLAMPTSAWSGDLYAEIENYSQDCRTMIQTNRSIGDTVTLQSLMKLVNDVDDRLRSIKEEWAARKRRPVPVFVVRSRRPG